MKRLHVLCSLVLLSQLTVIASQALGQAPTFWNEPDSPVSIAVQVDYLNWQRSQNASDIGLVSQGPAGPLVLSTGDVSLQNASGLRALIAKPLTDGILVEFGYLNQSTMSREAAVGSPGGPDDLFSIFSGFGDVPVPGIGFDETDQAQQAALSYSSRLASYELNLRYLVAPAEGPVTCTFLHGFRWISINEQAIHTIDAPFNAAAMDYRVDVSNKLFGAQIGGESWLTLLEWISIGSQVKAGFFFNNGDQQSTITATSLAGPLEEEFEAKNGAFACEVNLMLRSRLSDNFTLRAGYHMLVIEDVAVATDNFDFTPPFQSPGFMNPPRTPALVNDAGLIYHGFSAGIEAMW